MSSQNASHFLGKGDPSGATVPRTMAVLESLAEESDLSTPVLGALKIPMT
jgi:hypothetical protein